MVAAVQFLVGICIGVIGAVLYLVPAYQRRLEYVEERQNRRSNRPQSRPQTEWKSAEPGDNCPICLNPMNALCDMRYLPCKHALHIRVCYDECLKRSGSCPLCRRRMTARHAN